MKKRVSILLSACLVLSLAACGKGNTEAAGTADASAGNTAEDSSGTLTGKVTAIDSTAVTVILGELTEMKMDGQQPPEQPGGDNGQQPPQKPDGGDGQQPPQKPDGGDGQQPPERPEGDNGQQPPQQSDGADGQQPPQQPDGSNNAMPEGMPGGAMTEFVAGEETAVFDLKDAVITVEDIPESREGTLEDITVDAVITLETGDDNAVKTVTVKQTGGMGGPGGAPGFGGSAEVVQGTAANTIDEDGEYTGSYTSTGDDENALRVDGAAVTLKDISVDKSAGATSNTENGDFYGVNAGLLATNGAEVTITGAKVNTAAQNGNGVFSYGTNTTVIISDSVISTTVDNSGGIQTTGGGTTNARNLTVNTSGNSSAAIRSDRGGGTVMVDGGSYTSNGYNSPAVYSTADITVVNAALTATNSEALVIEGKNSITLENCTVSGNMSDDKGSCSSENVHNVMIYQSMSGDAQVGTAQFTMTGGKMTGNNGDLFYFTNTAAIMKLSGVEIENYETDGCLMRVVGNSEARGWGKAGENGAQVTFSAEDQTLEGRIVVDTISTLNMTLSGNSTFTGTVNVIENAQEGTAVSDNGVITLTSASSWTLTGDSAIDALSLSDDARVIIPAGITLTVDGTPYTDTTLTAESAL